MTRRFFTMIATIFLSMVAIQGQVTTRYVNNDITCLNSAAWGTEALPLCDMSYVAGLNATNITYLVDSYRDLTGPTFDVAATSTTQVTYRSRNNTLLGGGVDLVDANFVPHVSGTPGVFTLSGSGAGGYIWQTHFPNVVVDDPGNASYFEMDDADGPLRMFEAPTDVVLFANQGSFRWISGVLHVHTFGNVTPSVANTDLVAASGASLNFDNASAWLVLDGWRFSYVGTVYSMQINGTRHVIRNSTWSGTPTTIRGSYFTGENLRNVHMIDRTSEGCSSPCTDNVWQWYQDGSGESITITGAGHRLTNTEVKHAWNASISTENASLTNPPIIDRASAHGSPNHCKIGTEGAAKISNTIMFNCQDYNYGVDPVESSVNATGQIFEHSIIAASYGVVAENHVFGKLTFRNNIMRGNITYIVGLQSRCNWSQTIFENNVLSSTATIERCEDFNHYLISTYINNCTAGTWVNCATFRNNVFVHPSNWNTVVTGGQWFNEDVGGTVADDTWTPTPVPGGPAINMGTTAFTSVDYLGTARPFGSANDAGAYELADLGVAIYVDNACPNNGTGGAHTCASSGGGVGAFNALQPALDAATSPGDTVYIKNGSGTYVTTSGSRGQGVALDSGFAITHSGTEANPITIMNYTGHSPLIANCADGVTDYNSCARLTFSAWCQEGIRITGLRIRGSVGLRCNTTSEATLKRWNKIDHNELTVGFDEFDGNDWAGLTFSNQRYWHAHHNYIHAIAPMTNSGSQTSSSGLKLFTAVDGVAEYNTIKDGVTSGAGGIDDKQDAVRNTHRYNWMENVDTCLRFQFAAGTGPYTSATGTVAYQNVCIGRVGSTGPLWLVNAGAVTDLTVYNNVFYLGNRGFRMSATSGPTDGIRHYNNIYDAIATDNVQSLFTTTGDIDLENYNSYDPDANYIAAGATYTSLAAYVAAVPARNANSTEVACTFVNAGTDFHLSGGACVNGGRVGGTSGGAAVDRGAYINGIRCIGYGCEAPTNVK